MTNAVRVQESPLTPSPARMLLRGAAKRCAACGARELFSGWFRMADRCPGVATGSSVRKGFSSAPTS
jgi:uncharacterized protein (DUF983 family)